MKGSENKKKARLIAMIVLHLIVVVVTAYAVQSFFSVGGDGNMDVAGAVAFRYFTVDSNIFAGLSSLILMVCAARQLMGLENPGWIRVLSLAATTSVALTFMTVMLFLGPFVYGYALMFVGVSFFMHLTTPLMEIVSFVWLESVGAKRIKRRYMVLGVIPMLAYGVVYMTMVVFLKKWPDFYAFNVGGRFWLSIILMTTLTAGIAFGLGLSANLVAKKTRESEL
ncbi:MAG: hypothetical protein J6112_10525 [Clostridia bacterium]|nr:hypothetical protein [Clostridia bacterium]